MKRKLLFFDIDGTLLPEVDGQIPDSTINAIKRAQELGHYTFINTGRSKCIIPEQLLEMNFDGYLCGCGTYVTLHDEVLVNQIFDKQRGMDLILHARKEDIAILPEGTDSCYFDSLGNIDAWYEFGSKMFEVFPDKLQNINECDDVRFNKFCAIAKTRETLDKLLEPVLDYFDPIIHGPFCEVVPIGFSKASAIDVICEKLGQSLDDCYVFGDSNNDLSMLTHVKHSIAMGNSTPEVLRVSSYVTTPVWRDGIYVAMKHFGLI